MTHFFGEREQHVLHRGEGVVELRPVGLLPGVMHEPIKCRHRLTTLPPSRIHGIGRFPQLVRLDLMQIMRGVEPPRLIQ